MMANDDLPRMVLRPFLGDERLARLLQFHRSRCIELARESRAV